MTLYDRVTELPTQPLFHDRLRQSMARADRRQGALAVFLIAVVDEGGDDGAVDLARALNATVRRTDTVARIEPGVYAVIQTDLDHVDEAAMLAQKLLDACGRPEEGMRIGIALYPDDEFSPDGLVGKARAALDMAAARETPFAFCARDKAAGAEDRVRLARDLRRAIKEGELELHYQPKLSLASGSVVGAEALVRWRHPERGLLAPDAFIPLAEESDILVPLGAWVLREACRDAVSWPKTDVGFVHVAVNVAPAQLEAPTFAATVEAALMKTKLDPARLELEITERTLMTDAEAAAGVLVRLGQLGVKVTVDDFGTGYSALVYLRRFPVDALKIDRAFVADLPRNPNDAAIVRAIIGLARSLNLRVVAEGVDDERQRAVLEAEGCAEIQGFLVGAPMPAAAFAASLRGDPVPATSSASG